MKNILILLFLVYVLQGCLTVENNTTSMKDAHETQVYHYLKKELKAGYSHGEESQALEMHRDYFLVVGEELRRDLKQSGFRFLSSVAFKQRIKNIFNLNEDEYTQEGSRNYIDTIALPFTMGYLTFIPEKGLITMTYKLPEVVDYSTIYPKLASYEKRVNTDYIKSGNKKQRVAWHNTHKNYAQYTKNNRTFIVSLNKYLLNDDFSQRDWLLNHAYTLLYDLYVSGGIKDKALLKALLINAMEEENQHTLEWHAFRLLPHKLAEQLQYLFVLPKKVVGNYVIRKETFGYLEELINKEKSKNPQTSNYTKLLTQFVKRFKDDEAYSSAVTYIEKFIQRIR